MGILIILFVVLILGFLLCGITDDLGGFIVGLAVAGICTAILILITIYISAPGNIISYEMDKARIEYIINKEYKTGEEISEAVNIATKINKEIYTDRFYRNTFWFNIFIPKQCATLQTIDINYIENAKYLIDMED